MSKKEITMRLYPVGLVATLALGFFVAPPAAEAPWVTEALAVAAGSAARDTRWPAAVPMHPLSLLRQDRRHSPSPAHIHHFACSADGCSVLQCPTVLCYQHHYTAAVGVGASQGHGGGLQLADVFHLVCNP